MREFKFDLQRFYVELYGVYVPDWVVAPSEYVTFNFDYGPVTFEDYRNFDANYHLTGRSITNRYKYENPEVLQIGYDFEWAPGYDNYYYDSSGKCYVVGFNTWLKKEEITLSGDHRIVRLADQSENNLVPHFGNSAKYVQIYGTGTDDKIGNSGSYTKIYGGGGNDTISNSGDKVTITTGTGDDFIRNESSNSEVYASEGKNTVIGGGVISTGTDDDSIHCYLDGIIHAGDGNNTVEVVNGSTRKVAVKVTTGSGNDCITCVFSDVQAGDGQNVITSLGRSTIHCGKGDDKVNISGSENLIYTGNGNDIVTFTDI